MPTIVRTAWVLGLLATSLTGTLAARAAPSGVVVVGVRRPGAGGGDGLPAMAPSIAVDLDDLKLAEVERFDAQYGGPRTFRGVPLAALIQRIPAPAHADLALLHFANGIIIPLRHRDQTVMNRLQPLIARGMHLPDRGMTVGGFEPITSRLGEYADVPVVQFAGNKVVVAERWHPDVPARAEKDLSPWVHADSLVAIELVSAVAYNAMFDVSERTRPGLTLFRQSCQFCHGIRQVGAAFGPDFVDPVPVRAWKQAQQKFYWHVKVRGTDALARGELMPALRFMTAGDAAAVWAWLGSAADRPLRPYRPEPEAFAGSPPGR